MSSLTPVKLLGLCLGMGVLAFAFSALGMFFLYEEGIGPGFSSTLSETSQLAAPLSILFLFMILFHQILTAARLLIGCASFRAVPLLSSFSSIVSRGFAWLNRLSDDQESLNVLATLPRPILLLGVSLGASIFLAWIPYRPDLNPPTPFVGVDTASYADWMARMLSVAPLQAIAYSFVGGLEGSRPFLLLILYLTGLMGASPSSAMRLLPLVLAPFLTLAVFVFVDFGKGDARLAGLTALSVSVSYYFTIAMWGGYYANWLALAIVFLLLTSVLKLSQSPTRVGHFGMILLSTILFLTHPWTWVLVVSASSAFYLSLWLEARSSRSLIALVGIVLPGVLLDFVKTLVFSTQSVGADLTTKVSLDSILGFWGLTVSGLLFTHSGLLANWLVMGLAMLGGLSGRAAGSFERLLSFWVAAGSISFLFLDGYNKARLVYDLPIPILAAAGTVWLVGRVGSWNMLMATLCLIAILSLGAAYAYEGMLLV